MPIKMLIQFVLTIIVFKNLVNAETNKGVLTLDELTFDKIVSRFKYSLVKFAHAFPFGEDHDTYVQFAQSVANFSDIIVINLEIKDYGDKDCLELAKRFKVSDKEYPALRLFKDGNLENPIVFKNPKHKASDKIELNVNEIKHFIRQNTGLRLSLDNCSQELDEITEKFIKSSKTAEKNQLIKNAKEFVEQIKNKDKNKSANIYIKLMEKGLERGNKFFAAEYSRVKTLLKNKLTKDKKSELNARLNILQSFFITKKLKDEL